MNAAQPGALIAMKNTSGLCISRTATRLTRLGKAMSKTLADMTAEERADCVGMWADTTGQGLGVIVNATELSDCWVLFPEGGGRVATCHNQRVTPRFDLPRAWTPDGEPEFAQALAEETYEYAVQVKIGAKWLFLGRGTGGHNFARNAFWFIKKENAQDYMAIGKDMSAPARIVRRRVSPVEVISD